LNSDAAAVSESVAQVNPASGGEREAAAVKPEIVIVGVSASRRIPSKIMVKNDIVSNQGSGGGAQVIIRIELEDGILNGGVTCVRVCST
jgi:hypothetical protein